MPRDLYASGLLTDRYELTMLSAALRDGSAQRECTFEAFARRLPDGRRYGVVGGTGRLIEAITEFSFGPRPPAAWPSRGVIDASGEEFLADYRSTAMSTATPRASCSSPIRRC